MVVDETFKGMSMVLGFIVMIFMFYYRSIFVLIVFIPAIITIVLFFVLHSLFMIPISLMSLVSLILFIGLLWVLVSDERQGWHDKIARTCVIYDWPAREDDGVVGRLQSRWSYVKHTRRRLKDQRAEKKARGSEGEIEAAPEETEAA